MRSDVPGGEPRGPTRPGRPDQTLQAPLRINGFEEEIEEVMRCVRAGRIESDRVPHAETLALLGWIDRLRAALGVRYPFEWAQRASLRRITMPLQGRMWLPISSDVLRPPACAPFP